MSPGWPARSELGNQENQWGLWKTRLRRMLKYSCKVNVLAALTNLFLARRQLPGAT